ncbi:hypothetical protein ACIGBL_34230 [Streptomyces sp. NPDC085614]|uniref:hypothetical protein n=1 Tax=Streptomyces sp. NPDC085614 TaxID=3365733 RepID=UPI0037D6845E
MTGEENALEAAVAALRDAQAAVYAARRAVTAAMVAAYLGGETVARIAKRTGYEVIEVRNVLAAAQVTRSR